jgi:hypothetical protein
MAVMYNIGDMLFERLNGLLIYFKTLLERMML